MAPCRSIADATSLQYVLHAAVGDTMTIDTGGRHAADAAFRRRAARQRAAGGADDGGGAVRSAVPGPARVSLLPDRCAGCPDGRAGAALAEVVESDLQPFGVDAVSTIERLDAFHRVENTYLSTFQALGGLGLLLGTIGLATVMFRNVLERRRELALLRAVGYDARHVTMMILAETRSCWPRASLRVPDAR